MEGHGVGIFDVELPGVIEVRRPAAVDVDAPAAPAFGVDLDEGVALPCDPPPRKGPLPHRVHPDELAGLDDDAQGEQGVLEDIDEGRAGQVGGEVHPDLRHHWDAVGDAPGDRGVQPLRRRHRAHRFLELPDRVLRHVRAGLLHELVDLGHDLRVLGGNVLRLSEVGPEIVQLDRRAGAVANALPVAHPHRLLVGLAHVPVVEIEILVVGLLSTQQGRQHGDPVDPLRGRESHEIGEGRHDVPEREHLVADLAGGDPPRPARDEGHADASLVDVAFSSAQRPVAVEELDGRRHALVGPVVAREDHQGVLVEAQLADPRDEPSDVPVQAGDHRRVVLRDLGPVTVGVGRVARNDVVLGGVLRVVREVREGVAEIQEERTLPVLLDEGEGLLREEVVGVEGVLAPAVALHLPHVADHDDLLEQRDLLVVPEVVRVVEVGLVLVEVAVPVVEALEERDAPRARVPERPLAHSPGAVARLLQHLRDGEVVRSQPDVVGEVVPDAVVAVVHPRHEAAARGGTDGRARVGLGEPQALGGQPIEVRRLDLLLPVGAEITVAEVVGQDEDDVGSWPGCR